MSDISAVLVTYNSIADVPTCLDSLRTHCPEVEVVVVDNASADGTAAMIEREYPWVRLIVRATNGGLSAGVDEGVAASTGTYVAALNPDVHFDRDVLGPLAGYLREHPDVGVAAPKLLDDDGTLQLSCRAFPGYSTALFNRYSVLTRLFPKNKVSTDYLMTDFDHSTIRNVDWVSGAAMMFPRAVFDRLGGWDPGFFLFNEDVDFCRRVHDAGLRVVYDPEVSVFHRIGISKSTAPRVIVERHKSMWRYYRKHLRSNMALDAVTGAGIAARCGLLLGASGVRRLVGKRA
jgi:N-acetylglucosaminyl-diphospho-decaprenol L-rhamnosyltransferase